MDGHRGYYAKCNKSNQERQVLCDFTHMWNIKNKQRIIRNDQTKQKQTHIYREQSSSYQKGRRREGEMGKGDKVNGDR